MLQAQRQVVRHDDASNVRRSVGAHDAQCTGEDNQQRHDGDHTHDFRQYQVARRVDTHDVQRVNLLRHAHGADLRGDVRAHLTGQYQTHDARRELQQHDFARGIAAHPAWHPGRLDVQLHLDADDGSDEKRDEQHDTNRVDAQLFHLLDVLFPKHAEAFRDAERAPHQYEKSAEHRQPPMQNLYHFACKGSANRAKYKEKNDKFGFFIGKCYLCTR